MSSFGNSAAVSRCIPHLLMVDRPCRLPRHVDQRPALGMPGPVGVGHAVPDDVGAQLFAGNIALNCAFNGRASLGWHRALSNEPLMDGGRTDPEFARKPSRSSCGFTSDLDKVGHGGGL